MFLNKIMYNMLFFILFVIFYVIEVYSKPNIVYILLDDIGITDMFNNESVVPTPLLNSLLKEGVHFRNVSLIKNMYMYICVYVPYIYISFDVQHFLYNHYPV